MCVRVLVCVCAGVGRQVRGLLPTRPPHRPIALRTHPPPPNPTPTPDPKLLLSRPNAEALSAFGVTTLERQTLRELLLPADLGVPITLLDVDRYNAPPEVQTFYSPVPFPVSFCFSTYS